MARKTSKSARTVTSTTRAGAKPKPVSKRASAAAAKKKSKLLSGDNPQIAKGDGDAPVRAYIVAIPGWKRDVVRRLDEVIMQAAPGGCKAIRWNSPFYGIADQSWFLGVHCFTKYVKVAFFDGASLRPVPPVESKQPKVRYFQIHEGDAIDEQQLAAWVKQASKLPGWGAA